MIRKPSPATLEENAEIRALRDRADATGEEIAVTVTALAGKLAGMSPPTLARKKAAEVRARHPQLIVTAGLAAGILVLVTIAATWQRHRHA